MKTNEHKNISDLPGKEYLLNIFEDTRNLNFIINKNKLKYPISKNGHQCIGYCVQPPNSVYHPELKELLIPHPNTTIAQCPISIDPKNKKNLDECTYTDINNVQYWEDYIPLYPDLILKTDELLKVYNITSYNKGLEVIKYNNNINLLTKLRIVDCMWKVYYEHISIVNDTLIEFYVNVAKKLWSHALYKKFYHYIYITNEYEQIDKKISKLCDSGNENKVIYIKYNNQPFDYHKHEKINCFITKFINFSKMYEFLNKYSKIYNIKIVTSNNKPIYINTIDKEYENFINDKIQYLLT